MAPAAAACCRDDSSRGATALLPRRRHQRQQAAHKPFTAKSQVRPSKNLLHPHMQAAGYGKVVAHVIIGLKTVKGTKQLKLDPTIYDSLQKERVQVRVLGARGGGAPG